MHILPRREDVNGRDNHSISALDKYAILFEVLFSVHQQNAETVHCPRALDVSVPFKTPRNGSRTSTQMLEIKMK
jgi:hypothetical protein